MLGRRYAGHEVVPGVIVRPGSRRVGDRLAAGGQPLLDEGDLRLLRDHDALGEQGDVVAVGAVGHQVGHLQGLGVVGEHPLHERRVGGGVLRRLDGRDLLVGELAAGFARRPGLHGADVIARLAGITGFVGPVPEDGRARDPGSDHGDDGHGSDHPARQGHRPAR